MNHVSSEKDYLKEAQDNLKKAIYKHTSNEEQIDAVSVESFSRSLNNIVDYIKKARELNGE